MSASKLLTRLNRIKGARLVVMQLTLVQAGTFLLLLQNALASHDADKVFRTGASFLTASVILGIAWWALGRYLMLTRHAARLAALGADDKQAVDIANAEAGGAESAANTREYWDAYRLRHRLAITALDAELRRTLATQYKIRPSYIDSGFSAPLLVPAAAVLHASGKTAAEAAKDLHALLAADGEIDNPEFFTESKSGEVFATESGFASGLNKALFGVYARGPAHTAMTAVIAVLFAGSFYGYSGALFLPGMEWWYFGMGASAGLSIASVLWVVHGHLTGKILVKSNMSRGTKALAAVIMAPLVFMLYWGTITIGIGSLVTEMTGIDGKQTVTAAKFARHTSYGIKYCLRGKDFRRRAIFFYDDCTLSEQEFASLPKKGDVTLVTRTSGLGTLLRGLARD